MLITSQIRRLLNNAPAAMSARMTPSAARVGRRVAGPAIASAAAAKAVTAEMTKAVFSVPSPNRSRVSRPRTSTFPPSRGQWSISATRKKSRVVE